MRTLAANALHTPTIAEKTECLVTNGTGSFAALAINGSLSRKFHGLLIHSTRPPMDRILTWHSCVEQINGQSLDARKTDSNTNNGERFLTEFSAKPMPTWIYQINGHCLKKELFMVEGEPSTLIKYTLLSSPLHKIKLTLENFVNFRCAEHYSESLNQEDLKNWHINAAQQTISAQGLTLKLGCQVPYTQEPTRNQWFDINQEQVCSNINYAIEQQDQGYPQQDSSLRVQQTEVELKVGECCFMVATLNDTWPNSQQCYQKALAYKKIQFSEDEFTNDLTFSVQQFIAERESVNGKTILAGFPWFGDWGRDTMIALPGTTLATGQFETARAILKTYAQYLNAGMLPNKFPDRNGEPLKYNTIDATLWFFWAIQQYVDYSADWEFVKTELYDDLKDIIQHHKKRTRYGIGMDDDGLIQGGDSSTQLTWMDVKFDDYAVTPRYGKAVEINALWYNALCFAQQCSEEFNDTQINFHGLIEQVQTSFKNCFWNTELNCCFDYRTPEQANADIRCNQIFAVSLPFSPLTKDQQEAVFQCAYKHLYTPVGLRSLSPQHTDYKGEYYGLLKHRDMAYHQGTVWAWPIGAFIDAAIKVTGNKKQAAGLLAGLKHHFYYEAGIHGISEVFDGDAPHKARGCFSQAWSVAEVLRVVDKYQLRVPG